MNVADQIEGVIYRYVHVASQVLSRMHEAFGEANLMAAWQSGRLPIAGMLQLPGLGSGTYRFHGRGCYIEVDNTKIDIELCQDESCIGFDSWRLCRFAEESLDIALEQEQIERELANRVAKGTLGHSRQAPYFGLYFVRFKMDQGPA